MRGLYNFVKNIMPTEL